MEFNCDECCNNFDYEPDNINGRGQYCKKCVSKLIGADEFSGNKVSDFSKDGIKNWICLQEDTETIVEIISFCHKKLKAMEGLNTQPKSA